MAPLGSLSTTNLYFICSGAAKFMLDLGNVAQAAGIQIYFIVFTMKLELESHFHLGRVAWQEQCCYANMHAVGFNVVCFSN